MSNEIAPLADWSLAFGLYLLGLTQQEIADQVGCSQMSVSRRISGENWPAKRDLVTTERAIRTGAKISKEQEFIRAQECQYARRLMGLAEQMLRTVSTKDATLLDLTRVLDMASRLGRLGSGLPLNQFEVTQTYDLGENLMNAIERAYGPQAKPAITLPTDATPPKP